MSNTIQTTKGEYLTLIRQSDSALFSDIVPPYSIVFVLIVYQGSEKLTDRRLVFLTLVAQFDEYSCESVDSELALL